MALADIVIDLVTRLNLLWHFPHVGEGAPLPRNVRRRNVLAALITVGCSSGPAHLGAASGLSACEIGLATSWWLTDDALRGQRACCELRLEATDGRRVRGSVDEMRFHVPVNMYAYTTDTSLRRDLRVGRVAGTWHAPLRPWAEPRRKFETERGAVALSRPDALQCGS
ncbi:hypothetical protein ACFFLM_25950 [Deinococcus oregonensis]|uniref:Uncharacterized protein n=1 Tax=Deinococcus oregonensis TaxID=1805970 RepID=A0ABV6B6J9_9DEIO